jgi:glucose-1-phosphate thymidylyltransferase
MFPICNRPLLEWSVERLVAAGVTDIGIVIGHRGGRVRNHFGDGNRFGCAITYIEQREQLGTADAVCSATGYIGGDDFIAIHGDLFIGPEAIPQLLEDYTGKQSLAGIHQSNELNKHIRAEVDRENNISSYTWKPRSDNGIALS